MNVQLRLLNREQFPIPCQYRHYHRNKLRKTYPDIARPDEQPSPQFTKGHLSFVLERAKPTSPPQGNQAQNVQPIASGA